MADADRGRAQIENAILEFPNLVPQEIDLTQFMDEEEIVRVRDASQYKEMVRKLMSGQLDKGYSLPFTGMHDNFEFRPSEMTIWAGYKGHGKSSIIGQVLQSMMGLHQHKVFIISPEFPPHKVVHKMMVQFLATRYPDNEEFDEFFEVMKQCLWVYDQQRSIKPNTIIPLCRYAVEKLGVKHILIDSLMKCGISPEDYGAQKQFVDRLQNIAHITDVHIHLVAHARKGRDDHAIGSLHDIKGTSEIADMAENVIFVWRNKNKELHPKDESKRKEPDAIIKVEAQRNGEGWIGEVNLTFDKLTMKFNDWKDGI